MKISIRGYITHKEAEKYSDCADRYAVNIGNRRFAIADGVSKSFFPDYWADILVNNFVALEKDSDLPIGKWQAKWLEKVKKKVTEPDVKWFTKNAFLKQEPGLATFVGLRFDNGRWFANALGDSFLFFVPKENANFDSWIKLSSKPEPVVFDSFPDYFSSRNKQHGETQTTSGNLVAGTFYLMTDALSEWVFNQKEKAIDEIVKWHSQKEFERSVAELRSLNVLNNDDSAILIIEIENDESNKITYEKIEVQSLSELIEKEKSTEEEIVEDKKETFIAEAFKNTGEEKSYPTDNEKSSEKTHEAIVAIKKQIKYVLLVNGIVIVSLLGGIIYIFYSINDIKYNYRIKKTELAEQVTKQNNTDILTVELPDHVKTVIGNVKNIYEKAMQDINDVIQNSECKQLSEQDSLIFYNMLQEYGISLTNRDSNSN